MIIEDAVVDGKVGNSNVNSLSAGGWKNIVKVIKMTSRWYVNIIVTSIMLAISTMTMVTKREVGVAAAKMW